MLPKDLIEETISPGLEPFVADFLSDRKKDFTRLEQLVQAADFESARKIAHNWKGYCEPYGFAQLGVYATELEKMLIAKNNAGCDEFMESIRHYLANKTLAQSDKS